MKSWLALVSFGVITGFAVSAVGGRRPQPRQTKARVSRAVDKPQRGAVRVHSGPGGVLRHRERRRHGVHVLAQLLGARVRRVAIAYPLRPAPHQRWHQRVAMRGYRCRAGGCGGERAVVRRAGYDDAHHRDRHGCRRDWPGGPGDQRRRFAELLAAMRAGAAYANVHSGVAGSAGPPVVAAIGFPGGEIRGQIN